MLSKLTFVLGGAASGKSAWAENLLLSSCLEPVYLATARALDSETKSRITAHKSRRNDNWQTIEADLNLTEALGSLTESQAVLIDCATMWLSNHLMDELDLGAAQVAMFKAMKGCKAPIVIVSNEVGQGIVPTNRLAREFRETQGRLNIALAEQADLVVNVVSGLPVVLKGQLP